MSDVEVFTSILFPPGSPEEDLQTDEPSYFRDLNLDQLVVKMCAGRPHNRLAPYFWTRVSNAVAIRYRQDVMREIEGNDVAPVIGRFVDAFRLVRQQQSLMSQVRYAWRAERCLLDAAAAYCSAVRQLARDLEGLPLASSGLQCLRTYIETYERSSIFDTLCRDVERTQREVGSITYLLHVHGNRVHISKPDDEADLGQEVSKLFERFRDHGEAGDPVVFRGAGGFSHIDAAILKHVAGVFPVEFNTLAEFARDHGRFINTTVSRLASEVEFVLACLDFKHRMESWGLPMCYPTLSASTTFAAEGCYDAALAADRYPSSGKSNRSQRNEVVQNTVRLQDGERFIVVTGPNQGGKTTFARMVGQVHHLAALGCAVPAAEAEIGIADHIFTLFERQEDPGNQRGKLQDDLIRMRGILEAASPHSLVILNEVFTSTSTQDALDLSKRVLDPLLRRGCVGVCVTFLDELASYHRGIVSMVADVDPHDPSIRLYTVTRRPADGRAYAESLVAKYRLTSADIKERVTP